jgi:NADPH-dependent 2,4-dienoyl-CoA reductase/sulfur reductase-like enzyme
VLRTLDHLRELQARLHPVAPVVVIGSGFIGCEIAASLRMRGHPVDLLTDESAPNVGRLGEHAAAELAAWLEEDGVAAHFAAPVNRIDRSNDHLTAVADGVSATGRVIVMAAGVVPRVELAVQAGIELDDGAIPVNAAMRCSRADVLAAGDVCAAHNVAAGRPLRVEHWGDALAQGEIAGRTAAGEDDAWDAVPGFWSTIGKRTLKYAAWGDGFDDSRFEPGSDGGFTAWYERAGQVVGVLTHESDGDYERGCELIAHGARWS